MSDFSCVRKSLLSVGMMAYLVACQTSDSERAAEESTILKGNGYSAVIPTGWSQVDPIRLNIQEAPMEMITGASGRLKSRSEFTSLDERLLTDGLNWILIISGTQANVIQSPTDWVKVFSGSESNIRTRSSQSMNMALSVPPSPTGMYNEYVIAGRGRQILGLAGFSREEDAASLSAALARLVTSIRLSQPGRVNQSELGNGSDRFLR